MSIITQSFYFRCHKSQIYFAATCKRWFLEDSCWSFGSDWRPNY